MVSCGSLNFFLPVHLLIVLAVPANIGLEQYIALEWSLADASDAFQPEQLIVEGSWMVFSYVSITCKGINITRFGMRNIGF